VADPDDTSANGGSLCGKSSGTSGWNTQTTYTYFPDGSKQSAQSPSERAFSVSTSYTYDVDGDVVSETAHHGCMPNQSCNPGVMQKWYDGADRLVQVQQPWDPRTYTWPNTPGQTLPYDGARWMMRYFYDISGGATVSVQGAAPFSAHGNLYKTQKGSGASFSDVSGSAFDALDRETTKFSWLVGSDPGQVEAAQLQYDGGAPATLGLLTKKTNPAGESVTYAYDERGHISSQTYAGDNGMTPSEATLYDADGRVSSVTSSRFGAQQYAYDADGRLSSTTEPGGGGLTGAARISYSYYRDGKHSALSISSPNFTQTNALAYSYRPDGLLQTQTNAAFAAGTWSRTYTDAGRLRALAGAGAPSYTYDTTGQLQSETDVGQTMTYTHDPEGSVLSEAFPNVWPTGASAPVPIVRYSTINVRGELIDDTPPGTGPDARMTAHRTQTSGGCTARRTVVNDAPDDPSAGLEQDGRNCVVTDTGMMGGVVYNGRSYPQGHTTQFAFDAAGRANRTVDDNSIFFEGGPSSITNPTPHAAASARSVHTVTTTAFDAENHTVSRQQTKTSTLSQPDQGTSSTTTGTDAATTLGWGPNGHPVLLHDPSRPVTATQDMTLHWNGDMVLFVTDANGSVIDFKVGLDGEITPQDGSWAGLTMYDRDEAGVVMAARNATGQSNLLPLDPWDASNVGFGPGASGLRTSASQFAYYARPDGFKLSDIQINGVRAFDPALGSWTTPDAYEGDVHDPASQQKYMWNRGNAVDYSDPNGFTWDPKLRNQPISWLFDYMRAKSSMFNRIYDVLGASNRIFTITTDIVPIGLDGQTKGGLFRRPGWILLHPFGIFPNGADSDLDGMVERLAHEIAHAYDSELGGSISWRLAIAVGAVVPIDNQENRSVAREWFAAVVADEIMSELRNKGYDSARYKGAHNFESMRPGGANPSGYLF
jgi:YD repeat-containing protein